MHEACKWLCSNAQKQDENTITDISKSLSPYVRLWVVLPASRSLLAIFAAHLKDRVSLLVDKHLLEMSGAVPANYDEKVLPSSRVEVQELLLMTLPKYNPSFMLIDGYIRACDSLVTRLEFMEQQYLFDFKDGLRDMRKIARGGQRWILTAKHLNVCMFKRPGATWTPEALQKEAQELVQKLKETGFWSTDNLAKGATIFPHELRLELCEKAGYEARDAGTEDVAE